MRALQAAHHPKNPWFSEQPEITESMSALSIDVEDDGANVAMVVGGVFDAVSLDTFLAVVEGLDQSTETVILDMSGLEFMDSTGAKAAALVRERFRQVMIRNAPPVARRVLEVAGLNELIID